MPTASPKKEHQTPQAPNDSQAAAPQGEKQNEAQAPPEAQEKEAKKTRYLTREDFLAYNPPVIEPGREEFTLPGFAAPVLIVGVTAYGKQRNIFAEIDRLIAGKRNVTHPQTGASYRAADADLVAAAWLAACVTPALSALEWLQYGAEADLTPLYARCLVCSRRLSEEAPEEAPPI